MKMITIGLIVIAIIAVTVAITPAIRARRTTQGRTNRAAVHDPDDYRRAGSSNVARRLPRQKSHSLFLPKDETRDAPKRRARFRDGSRATQRRPGGARMQRRLGDAHRISSARTACRSRSCSIPTKKSQPPTAPRTGFRSSARPANHLRNRRERQNHQSLSECRSSTHAIEILNDLGSPTPPCSAASPRLHLELAGVHCTSFGEYPNSLRASPPPREHFRIRFALNHLREAFNVLRDDSASSDAGTFDSTRIEHRIDHWIRVVVRLGESLAHGAPESRGSTRSKSTVAAMRLRNSEQLRIARNRLEILNAPCASTKSFTEPSIA